MTVNPYFVFFCSFYFSVAGNIKASQKGLLPELSHEYSLQEANQDTARVRILIKQSDQFMGTNFEEAFASAGKAYRIALNSNNVGLLMLVNSQIGKLYFYNGGYVKAIQHYSEVLKSAEAVNDSEWIGKGYAQLGRVRLVLEDYEEAERHFIASKRHLLAHYKDEAAFPVDLRLSFFNNLGVIYAAQEKYEEAVFQFESGIELAEIRDGHGPTLVQLLNNLGDLMRKKGLHNRAKFYYQSALGQLAISPFKLMESMVYNGLGQLYLDSNNPDSARIYFSKGFKLVSDGKAHSHLKHLSESLSNSFSELGQADSALHYLKLSRVYLDSLNLAKSAEKIHGEELLIAFTQEKSLLQGFYKRNKAYLLVLVFLISLMTLYFVVKHYLAKKSLEVTMGEKFRLEMSVQDNLNDKEALREKLELNQKEQTIMALNNIQKEQILKKMTASIRQENVKELALDTQGRLNKLVEGIKQNNGEQELSEFEFRFSKLYVGFFDKLHHDYPDLTLNERRLAAFLKLQLTTKEITGITGQSVRAVEIARTRLRKKLKLTKSDKSLYDFFVDF